MLVLQLRREMLHDFLVDTGSERPALSDARVIQVGRSLRIGPTSVDVDFIGSPIVRAQVTNVAPRVVDVLVTAIVHDERGSTVRATTWIEGFQPGAHRAVELDCPGAVKPVSVDWSVTEL